MRVVVYGSLRQGQGNSHWLTNGQWLGNCLLEGYELYHLGLYPGAVKGTGSVFGEVYRIDASTLLELDALRIRGGEYKRELVPTPFGNAWMYIYQRPLSGLKRIVSGDWLLRDETP